MPNALERELRRTRRLIVAEDRAAQQRMAALYRQAVAGLESSLARFADIPLDEMTPGQAIADARYRQLLAETDAAFARFARDGEFATQDARLRAARIGQQQALPLMQAAAPDVLATAFTRLPEAALQELLGVLGPDSPLRAVLDRYGVRGAEIIERELVQGMARGVNSRRIAAAIRRELGGERWRAEMLARTETHRAFRGATLQTYARHPHILDGWRWSAAKSTWTCLACLALDGDTFPLSDDFMKAHVACFPAGVAVSGAPVVSSTQRWYSGDLIEIHTERGRRLPVTPNHPILTPEGWIAAGLLHEGDDLVCRHGQERDAVATDHDDQHVPTLIEEVAQTLGRSLSVVAVRVPTAAEDFHGDGLDGEVCVVRTDGALWGDIDAPCAEHGGEVDLGGRAMRHPLFAGLRSPALLCERLDPALTARMGRSGETGTFVGAGLRHANEHAFGPIAGLDSVTEQRLANRAASGTERGGERLLRLARLVAPHDFVFGQDSRVRGAELDAAGFEQLGDPIGSGSIAAGKGNETLPLAITTDRIVRVNRQPFSGHVYNLETVNGWYYAEGIIAHNCRCSPSPYRKGGPAERIQTGEQWFLAQGEDTQRLMLPRGAWDAFASGDLTLRDFIHEDDNPVWGPSFRKSSLTTALARAERRQRRRAA